jgi:alkylation response protein AidB-like acyl-CoA dehydrogenase
LNDSLPEQHRVLLKELREFLGEISDEAYTTKLDNEGTFPEEAWHKLAKGPWIGWSIAQEYGGSGGDLLGAVLIVEELCRQCFPLGQVYVSSAYSAAYAIGLYGSPSQRATFLPELIKGRAKFAFAMTEPGGGQDLLGGLQTTATETESGFRINGRKMYVTHASTADYMLVLVRTADGPKPSAGLSLFLLDRDTPGVAIETLESLVLRANAGAEVIFTDVLVDADRIVGERDSAWRQLVLTLDIEKVMSAAEALGNAQAALEYAIDYAKERNAFGGPIGRFQSLQHYLAEAAVRVEAARLLTYNAARQFDAGEPIAYESLLCKIAASEAGVYTTDVGMRIMAGAGYLTERPMQRYFRDSRVYLTGPITNELARNQLAERLGLPRSY